MCATRTFLFLVQISGILVLVQSQNYDLCRTPRSEQGECKPINMCASLFAYLQHRPIRSQDADFLRRSQCGFNGTLPNVCCPFNEASNSPSVAPAQAPQAAAEIQTTPASRKPIESDLLPDKKQCGQDFQDKIFGGEVADLSEFPWMALIEYERDNGKHGFYCGGVMISKRYILTAAHCLKGKDLPRSWKLISVRLGEYNTDTEIDCVSNGHREECAPAPQNILVEEQLAHEQYDPYDINQYHDIALLRLAREAKISGYVSPICLPTSSGVLAKDFTGNKLTVAGWGKTENRSESNVKLKLNVPVKSNEVCSKTYRQANVNLLGGQMCAGGEKGRDSCRGDSGGPLMSIEADDNDNINWFSIGVVSFGPSPCGIENWPGVYTKVSNYVDWIVSKLRP